MTTTDYVHIAGLTLQTLLFLVGGYGMVLRNDWSNRNLEKKMETMQTELKELAKVVITQAVQTTQIQNLGSQLTMLQRTVEDLRRGNGFVQGRAAVDGEYPQ